MEGEWTVRCDLDQRHDPETAQAALITRFAPWFLTFWGQKHLPPSPRLIHWFGKAWIQLLFLSWLSKSCNGWYILACKQAVTAQKWGRATIWTCFLFTQVRTGRDALPTTHFSAFISVLAGRSYASDPRKVLAETSLKKQNASQKLSAWIHWFFDRNIHCKKVSNQLYKNCSICTHCLSIHSASVQQLADDNKL